MPTIQPLKGNPPATSIRIVRAVVSRRRKLPAMFNPRGGRRFADPVATPARREPAARAKNFGIFRSQERLYLRLAKVVVYPHTYSLLLPAPVVALVQTQLPNGPRGPPLVAYSRISSGSASRVSRPCRRAVSAGVGATS